MSICHLRAELLSWFGATPQARCGYGQKLFSDCQNLPNRRIFDDGEVVQLLKVAIEQEGNQMAFAKRHGVNRTLLNAVANGKRHASGPILKRAWTSQSVRPRPKQATRRFTLPWSVEDIGAAFVVTDSAGQKLAYVYFEG
jgi:hypothetical protein